ncbi:MAG: nicotinamide riboside transporter PnuC [Limnohabitans sp.]
MMSLPEGVGFVLALLMVLCSIRELHWTWPLAAASSVMYFFVFRDSGLYAEAGLQLVFVTLALWGWWQWMRRDASHVTALQVQRVRRSGVLLGVLALAVLWPGIASLLITLTDSDVPWWDALVVALSLIGQVMLGRKLIENWAVWIVVNALSVVLFASRGLWLTVVLYSIFLLLSLQGWRVWRLRLATRP